MDSISPVTVPNGQWLDVYNAAGITVGTPLLVQVKKGDVELSIKATAPTSEAFGAFNGRDWIAIDGGESGLWARASGGSAELYVQEDA